MPGQGGGAELATLVRRFLADEIWGSPSVPPISTRLLLFGGAEHTVSSFCTAKLLIISKEKLMPWKNLGY